MFLDYRRTPQSWHVQRVWEKKKLAKTPTEIQQYSKTKVIEEKKLNDKYDITTTSIKMSDFARVPSSYATKTIHNRN